MALARTSLRGFLTHAKGLLQIGPKYRPPITFVIGNESADLDSISSAILYSYIASISPQTRKPPTFHIPVINIPRADLSLRTELLAVLPKANITINHLITLDDLGDLSTIHKRFPPEDSRWILVDHNALQSKLGSLYRNSVVGVIDHHDDENVVPTETGDEPRIIQVCGSCTSLVISYFRNLWDAWFLYVSFSGAANGQGDNLIEDGAFATLWDAQVAMLALSAVLIDTANLKDVNKTTPLDVEAVKYLETKVKLSLKGAKEYERDKFFEEITRAKMDFDGISVRDVLRKDYKEWREQGAVLGTAAVVRPIEYLVEKVGTESEEGGVAETLAAKCKAFAEERELDIMAVMTAYSDEKDDFRRELMLVWRTTAGQQIVQKFVGDSSEHLGLEQVASGQDHVIWTQSNLAASRKQSAPLLRKAMSSYQ